MNEYKILIVDDEEDILTLLEKTLKRESFHRIIKTDNGPAAVNLCMQERPDFVILDVMLPGLDGYEVCKQVRQFSHCPILFLSSKNDELDKILGLAVGGDDYVTKPFSPKEVVYRVKAQLRREAYRQTPVQKLLIQIGTWTIDPDGCRVTKDNREIGLTAREFEILRYLAQNMGRVISRERLYETIWGEDSYGCDNTIMVHIRHLREREIRRSDKVKEETDRTRREWITNITHDLKTPFSPVKGYAELLAENDGLDSRTARECGEIILKNMDYAEKLINDLKLTYQLDSGSIPRSLQEIRLVRFLKELVIDVVNDPAFAGRLIEFESEMPEHTACIDPALFRRAVQNLIINALIHNPPETKVEIAVKAKPNKGVAIVIRDNGIGLSVKEQSELLTGITEGQAPKKKQRAAALGLPLRSRLWRSMAGI